MNMFERLVKLADSLDKSGRYNEANLIDECIIVVSANSKNRVIDAINNTDEDYFNKTLGIRNPGGSAEGSRFSEPQTKVSLKNATWEPYFHESIKSPAVGFSAKIPGIMGIVRLSDLPQDMTVVLTDPKDTGKLSATVSGPNGVKTDYTVILLGPSGDKEVVLTFFPGEPILPSQLDAVTVPEDERNITVSKAIDLGLEFGKIVDKH